MALFLTHYTMSGEPVGIHNQFGEDYYAPGRESFHRPIGDSTNSKMSWDDFVEKQTSSFNQRSIWGSVEDSRDDLEEILDSLISEYNSK